jgi:hypothetical protein
LIDLSRNHPMAQTRKEWIGRQAPEFSLADVDGHRMRLSRSRTPKNDALGFMA